MVYFRLTFSYFQTVFLSAIVLPLPTTAGGVASAGD